MSWTGTQREVDGLSVLADGELVVAYVTRDDQAAFTELVRRHSGLVLGVVHRRNAERVEQAAYQALHRFTRALDLTDEQKDAMFQELSRRAWDGVGPRTQRSFVLNYTPSISDLPKVDETAAAAAVLSPEQVAAWQKHIKEEGEFTERMTKKVMPIFMPGVDPSDLPGGPEARGNM